MLEIRKVSSVAAIKEFFEKDGGRKVDMAEFRALSQEERQQLAALCAKALGVELQAAT